MGDDESESELPNPPRAETQGPLRVARTAAGLAHTNTALLGLFPDVAIIAVKILKLTFKGDHHVVTNYTADWKKGGEKSPKPHWTFGHPSAVVSISKGEAVEVEAVFEVEPKNASPPFAALHHAQGTGLGLTFDAYQRFSGGEKEITAETVKLTLPAPDSVAKLSGDIKWQVSDSSGGASTPGGSTWNAGASWGHTVFVTFDEPRDAGGREAGFTLKRMEKAVELVAARGVNEVFQLVRGLMKLFDGYMLTPNPALAEFKHPNYLNNVGGVWPLADHIGEGAECQAICRFVRALLYQVGCPGKFEIVVVYADPGKENGTKALEDDWTDDAPAGLESKWKRVDGDVWYAVLVDNPVEVGKVYDYGEVGPNNFEACLKVTAPGPSGKKETKYYGGGAGTYDDKDSVLRRCFWGLCWITRERGKYRVQQIVTRYK
ncbi:hypothetical protein LZC95_20355 [Pendulispora brunnea]|uniref:Transglutaminase-like domain-containing protein n=1 Tax=Pendulispora brunnea TaxID=2905690 RepID=A0ABZ2KKG2_9BACT